MNRVFVCLSLFLTLSLSACLDTNDPDGDSFLSGSVNLTDDLGNSISNAGMAVTLVEALPVRSDTTFDDGSFLITEIPFGAYTLEFEKDGFGTFKLFNVPIGQGGISDIPTLNLGRVSTTKTTSIQDSISGEDIFIKVSVEPAGTPDVPRFIRLFFNDLGNVGPEVNMAFTNVLRVEAETLTFTVNQAELLDIGFGSGQTVYVRAYGESVNANNYEDPNLGRNVFPNVNLDAANSIFFQVP